MNIMTMNEFKSEMLFRALCAGKALCEVTMGTDIQKEPEQVRRNVSTILTLLTETEDFIKEISNNVQGSEK